MLGIRTMMAERRARRAEADLRAVTAQKRAEVLQSYDAARSGGRMAGWARPQTSATTEIQPALTMLRASSRDLVRNSAHASRALRVLESHIAGTGVRPRAQIEDTADKDTREAIMRITRDQWDRFVENCDPDGQIDFYGQQRLAVRAIVESGEALRIWFRVSQSGRLFWRCRIVEGDYLDHQNNAVLANGHRIVQGVEFDAIGKRVAYHMHKHHPGDRYGITGFVQDTQRIPAEFVDHMFEVLRPGQVRGVSWFAPVATVMRDLDDLAEAEIVRKKLEACIAMVVHNDNDDDAQPSGAASISPAQDDSGIPLRDGAGNPVERMSPGMVVEARPGWSVDYHAPTASAGLVDHMKERLHAIAAGIGVTYMQMTGDTSLANYSSMREGRLEFNRLLDTWQDTLMVHQSARPAWRRVMEAAQVNGDLRTPIIPRARYIAPKRPWVDPQKDARALIEQMSAGLVDPAAVIEETGASAEDVVKGLNQWRDMLGDLAVTPDFKPQSDAGTQPPKGE